MKKKNHKEEESREQMSNKSQNNSEISKMVRVHWKESEIQNLETCVWEY